MRDQVSNNSLKIEHMKKHMQYLFLSASIVIASFAGCKKKSNTPIKPDVSNFSATALSPYTIGTTGSILITSTSLAAGDYTLKYHYTPFDTNNTIYQAATLVMSNHTGSFQTPILTDATGTDFTIDTIINSIGNGVALTTNNLVALVDSTGLMTATIGSSSFRVVSVAAEINGNNLSIGGQYYLFGPGSGTQIFFAIQNYVAAGTYSFTNDFWGGDGALFTYSGSHMVIDTARYGTIIITATSPQLSGSFSVTCLDSTKMAGTFICAAP